MAHSPPQELENSSASFSKNRFSCFIGEVATWAFFEVEEIHSLRMEISVTFLMGRCELFTTLLHSVLKRINLVYNLILIYARPWRFVHYKCFYMKIVYR
jgi:hypothetical protein